MQALNWCAKLCFKFQNVISSLPKLFLMALSIWNSALPVSCNPLLQGLLPGENADCKLLQKKGVEIQLGFSINTMRDLVYQS